MTTPYRSNASALHDAENAADTLELALVAREAKRRRLRAALGVFLLIAAADGTLFSAKPEGPSARLPLQAISLDTQLAYETSRHVPLTASSE